MEVLSDDTERLMPLEDSTVTHSSSRKGHSTQHTGPRGSTRAGRRQSRVRRQVATASAVFPWTRPAGNCLGLFEQCQLLRSTTCSLVTGPWVTGAGDTDLVGES